MKRIIVAIDDACMNNFQHLPSTFTSTRNEEIEILIHRDPVVEVVGTRIKANFDLLITDSSSATLTRLLPPHMAVVIPRPSKVIQTLRLNRAAEASRDISHFIPVEQYYSSNKGGGNSSMHFGPEITGTVVVKGIHGARGIGQMVIPTDTVPVASIVDKVLKSEGGDTSWDKSITDEYPDVKIPVSRERYAGEGRKILGGHMVAQKLVEGIESEHRLLVAPTGEILAYPRTRTDERGYVQASGVPKYTNEGGTFTTLSQYEPLDKYKMEIPALLDGIQFEYGSVDVFVTKDGWGVFEYSNEFGTVGYDIPEMADFHRMCISKWIEHLYCKPIVTTVTVANTRMTTNPPVEFYPDIIRRYVSMLQANPLGVADKYLSTSHLLEMLDKLRTDLTMSNTKKHRWLGYIQGCMVSTGLLDVDFERAFTRPIFNGC